MAWFRRDVLAGGLALAITGGPAAAQARGGAMHGLIGKMRATPGRRDALIAILLEGTSSMPGCLSYVVAKDPAEADTIWVTEVWNSLERHIASLQLPNVRATIQRARPLIAGVDTGQRTIPVGGVGLPR